MTSRPHAGGQGDEGEDLGPDEDDLTTDDHVHFYQHGRVALTIRGRASQGGGREAGADASERAMWRQLDAWMARERFFPNVWFIDDHGGSTLMQRPKRARRRSATARVQHERAVAEAEREYGAGGPLISGGLREHWPPQVQDRIRRLAARK